MTSSGLITGNRATSHAPQGHLPTGRPSRWGTTATADDLPQGQAVSRSRGAGTYRGRGSPLPMPPSCSLCSCSFRAFSWSR